jgi:anti-sigma B factor antagonist
LFTLDVRPETDHLLLRLGGELDLHSRLAFRERLAELTQEARQPVVLDLSDLKFIDSSGLGALLGIIRVPEARRPRLVLARSDGPVGRVLRTTRLDLLLRVHPNVEAALAASAVTRSAA